jgi:pimeloyl-ACP methyl ester carboxylesterase
MSRLSLLKLKHYSLHFESHLNNPHSPTILFIHGFLLDATEWDLLVKELDADFNYVLYDLYGHGQTMSSDLPITFDLLFSELTELICALKLEKVHLVGNGFGGNLAFDYARQHSDQVASLTLLSSSFYLPGYDCQRGFALVSQLMDIDRELLTQKVMSDCLFSRDPEKQTLFRSAFQKIPAAIFKDSLDLLWNKYDSEHFHFVSALEELTVPTLLLHGDRDQLYPIQFTALYSTCILNSRWFNIPNASHALPIDQPNLVANYLIKFITSSKMPIPVMPVHQQFVSGFRDIIQKIFTDHYSQRHVLTMNMMHDVEVLWDGKPIDGKWNQRRAKEILLYLFLNKGIVNRDQLIHAFLSDMPQERAKNNLRVWLSHLNKLFHHCADPSVREILIIGEDTIAINAELTCDVRTYMDQLTTFIDEKLPLYEKAATFIKLLNHYNPSAFSAFRCDWIFTLSDEIEDKLVSSMEQLLPKLEQNKMVQPMREILQAGRVIEPYDGFCDEKLALLQMLPQ